MSENGRITPCPSEWHTETFQDFVQLDSQDDFFITGNSPFYSGSSCGFSFSNPIYDYQNAQILSTGSSDGARTLTDLSPVSSQSQVKYASSPLSGSPNNDTPRSTGTPNSIIQQGYSSTLEQVTPPPITSLPPQPNAQLQQLQQVGYPSAGKFRSYYNSSEFKHIHSDGFQKHNETSEEDTALPGNDTGNFNSYNSPRTPTTPSGSLDCIDDTPLMLANERQAESIQTRRRSQRIRGQMVKRGHDRRKPYHLQGRSFPNKDKAKRKRNAVVVAEDSVELKEKHTSLSSDDIESQNLRDIAFRGESTIDERSPIPVVSPTTFEINDWRKAYMQIIEEPQPKALRFRYICEGRSAGSIPGVRSKAESKTYPAIKICDYKGPGYVKVSCVTRDPPYHPHPHNLVGKEGCKDGICTVRINDAMECVFPNLGIQCVKRKDVEEALSKRQKHRIDPFGTGYGHRNQIQNIDLNSVRLCFQAFIEDPKTGKTMTLKPVVSEPIYDKKATSDLVICKLSDCTSTAAGGKEIIILCEKVAREDIQVRFYEIKDGRLFWESAGEFQTSDVHKQVAICLRTPKYKNIDIENPVNVKIQLVRPSDRSKSEPRPFEYVPIDTDFQYVKKKMTKRSSKRNLNLLMSTYLPSYEENPDYEVSELDSLRTPHSLEKRLVRNEPSPPMIRTITSISTDTHYEVQRKPPHTNHPQTIEAAPLRRQYQRQHDTIDTDIQRRQYSQQQDVISTESHRLSLPHQQNITVPETDKRILAHDQEIRINESQRRVYAQRQDTLDPDIQKRVYGHHSLENELKRAPHSEQQQLIDENSQRRSYVNQPLVVDVTQRRPYGVSPPPLELYSQRKFQSQQEIISNDSVRRTRSHMQDIIDSEMQRRPINHPQDIVESHKNAYDHQEEVSVPQVQKRVYNQQDTLLDGIQTQKRTYGPLDNELQRKPYSEQLVFTTVSPKKTFIYQENSIDNDRSYIHQSQVDNAPHRRPCNSQLGIQDNDTHKRRFIQDTLDLKQDKSVDVMYNTASDSDNNRLSLSSSYSNQSSRSIEESSSNLNENLCIADSYFEIGPNQVQQVPTDEHIPPVIIDLDTHRRIDNLNYTDLALNPSELSSVPLDTYNDTQISQKGTKCLRDMHHLDVSQNSYSSLEDSFLLSEEIVGFIQT